MGQNYPKWPKNDAQIYALFPQFFLTEKAIPKTFSLLECMLGIELSDSFVDIFIETDWARILPQQWKKQEQLYTRNNYLYPNVPNSQRVVCLIHIIEQQ